MNGDDVEVVVVGAEFVTPFGASDGVVAAGAVDAGVGAAAGFEKPKLNFGAVASEKPIAVSGFVADPFVSFIAGGGGANENGGCVLVLGKVGFENVENANPELLAGVDSVVMVALAPNILVMPDVVP